VVLALVCLAIGGGLVWQRSRFENTPSYAILLTKLPYPSWGLLYLLCGLLLMAHLLLVRALWFAILAHAVTGVLLVSWLSAFVIRYFTDRGTTIVNVVSWSVYTFLLVRSAKTVNTANEVPGPAGDLP
jgi:hypothetical protein